MRTLDEDRGFDGDALEDTEMSHAMCSVTESGDTGKNKKKTFNGPNRLIIARNAKHIYKILPDFSSWSENLLGCAGFL